MIGWCIVVGIVCVWEGEVLCVYKEWECGKCMCSR